MVFHCHECCIEWIIIWYSTCWFIFTHLSVYRWSGEITSVIYHQEIECICVFWRRYFFCYLTFESFCWINQYVKYHMVLIAVHHLWQLKELSLGTNILFYLRKIDKLVKLQHMFCGIHSDLVASLVSTLHSYNLHLQNVNQLIILCLAW